MQIGNHKKLLFLLHGPRPLRANNRFKYLSQLYAVDVIMPTWDNHDENSSNNDPVQATSNTQLAIRTINSWKWPIFVRIPLELAFYLGLGLWLSIRKGKYDVIIAFGTTKAAAMAWLISRITGAKLVIEVPIVVEKAYLLNEEVPSQSDISKNKITRWLGSRLLPKANRLHLMFPTQVDFFESARSTPKSVFHDFVPVEELRNSGDDGSILLIGSPLYLKGADVVIDAFLSIADDFPSYRLKVVGYSRNQESYAARADGHQRIEISRHLPHKKALELVSRASCVVIASRTDAMPRLAIEAMAMAKPLLAASVDGIPHYLSHNLNCVLFPAGNLEALRCGLRKILSDIEFRRSISEQASKTARNELSEDAYIEAFKTMVNKTTEGAL